MSRGDARARLEQALADHGCAVRGNSAQCPGPDHSNGDRNPSLSIGDRKDGNGAVISCKGGSGCSTDDILEALGMSAADLFDEPLESGRGRRIAAEYDYVDEAGALLFRAVRFDPKEFRQYHLDGGRQVWNLRGVRRVLYRLPRVIEAVKNGETVYVAEGEKDVHAIEAAGAVATCNPMGAGKWRPEFADVLAGANVVIVADRDEPGRKHAADVVASLDGKAKSIRIVEPAVDREKADAADHLAAGHSLGELVPASLPDAAEAPEDSREPAGADQEFLQLLRSSALTSDDLDSIPDPQPVIDGLLYRDGIAWLYGKPSTFKSVLAIDWASCVSVGLPWQEHETVQGTVVYFYIEGRAGLRGRVRAWEDRAGCKSGIIFQPIAAQLLNRVHMTAMLAWFAELRPSLVILDTQARVTVGVEENSAMDMGRVVDAAGVIIRATGCCLLMIHHEGRNGDNPRGSIAIEGAATSLFRTERDGDVITLQNKRQRDIAEADDIKLRVTPRLHSVLLDSNSPSWSREIPSASELKLLQVLTDVFLESGASATTLIKATGLPESTFYNALKNLVSAGKVANEGTRGRTRYVVASSPLLQPTPTNSNGAAPEYSNSNPPFRGLESTGVVEPGVPQETAGGWPEGSIGEESAQ